jgi:hypothetical protein
MRLPLTKALGMCWEANEDYFTFTSEPMPPTDQVWTRRKVLSKYSGHFDPMGVSSPIVVPARLCYQKLCRGKKDWDEPLDPQEIPEWFKWLEGLTRLHEIKVDRCLCPLGMQGTDVQLHIFTDASGSAYGAVAYVRSEREGQVTVRLNMSTVRITPMHGVSIPRAELLGAVIGAQLASQIKKALGIPDERVTMWTDSQNVLAWIKNDDICLQTFVHNRVKVIQECTKQNSWRWVGTTENPADHLSRGRTVGELLDTSQWWNGPAFLQETPDKWPVDKRSRSCQRRRSKNLRTR